MIPQFNTLNIITLTPQLNLWGYNIKLPYDVFVGSQLIIIIVTPQLIVG